jgi:hypothetical protein
VAAGLPAASAEDLRWARDVTLPRVARLTAVDRTLAFSDPAPEAGQSVVGPHGDRATFGHSDWRATHYDRDLAEGMVAVYRDLRPGAPLHRWAGAFLSYVAGVDIRHQTLALAHGVTFTAQEAAEDAFCRALRILDLLTSKQIGRAPSWYHAIQVDWAALSGHVSPAGRADYELALIRLSDSWRHNDDAAWQLMRFPSSTRCATR